MSLCVYAQIPSPKSCARLVLLLRALDEGIQAGKVLVDLVLVVVLVSLGVGVSS